MEAEEGSVGRDVLLREWPTGEFMATSYQDVVREAVWMNSAELAESISDPDNLFAYGFHEVLTGNREYYPGDYECDVLSQALGVGVALISFDSDLYSWSNIYGCDSVDNGLVMLVNVGTHWKTAFEGSLPKDKFTSVAGKMAGKYGAGKKSGEKGAALQFKLADSDVSPDDSSSQVAAKLREGKGPGTAHTQRSVDYGTPFWEKGSPLSVSSSKPTDSASSERLGSSRSSGEAKFSDIPAAQDTPSVLSEISNSLSSTEPVASFLVADTSSWNTMGKKGKFTPSSQVQEHRKSFLAPPFYAASPPASKPLYEDSSKDSNFRADKAVFGADGKASRPATFLNVSDSQSTQAPFSFHSDEHSALPETRSRALEYEISDSDDENEHTEQAADGLDAWFQALAMTFLSRTSMQRCASWIVLLSVLASC